MEGPTKHYLRPPSLSKLNILVYETKQTMAFAYGFMTSSVFCILLILLSDPYGRPSSSSSSSSSRNWYIKDASPTNFYPNSSQAQNTTPVLCLPPNVTQPIKPNGLVDSPSDGNPVAVMNLTAEGQISESDDQGKEIGGLRDEQNITDTSTHVYSDSTSTNVSTNANIDTSTSTVNIDVSTNANTDTSTNVDIGKEIGGLRDEQNITDTSTDVLYSDSTSTNVSTNANIDTSTSTSVNIDASINASTNANTDTSTNVYIGKEIGGLRDEQNITDTSTDTSTNVSTNANSVTGTSTSDINELYGHIESMLDCDLFDGNWVRDDSYPLYPHGSCPYVDEQFNCFVNGRPDSTYESYRWQPKHCNIPRLKGKDLLELIRGKRLVFVGDSLNRNMYESLVCILKNSVEDQSTVARNFRKHKFKDYNCSVEFFWSPFLVHEWKNPIKRLSLDLMDMQSDQYKNADILVFNSGHWYTDFKTSNGRNYYQQGSAVYGKLDEFRAYRRGMLTWGKWVDANVNRMNTQVFFRGSSATHFGGGKWNSGGRCDWETKPIKKAKYLSGYPEKMKILESVVKRMRTRVHYLNITRLSDYRKDAHPAAYRKANLTDKERRDPLRFQDCTHWCLPGVPDTWNEILYAQLLINHYKKHNLKSST